MSFWRNDQGETLVEVVLALAILSLVLTGAYVIATHSFRQGRGAGERTQAANYLQEQAEALRSFRDKQADWNNFANAFVFYLKPAATRSFCMVKDTASSSWIVVEDTDPGCTKDRIHLSAQATASSPNGLGVNEEYAFLIKADWETGPDVNNTSITTTLTNQRAKP